jgi:SNF2 family DNA or RNA helicase
MFFEIGTLVHLRADPSRQGVIIAGPKVTGTVTRWQVQYADGTRELQSEKSILKIGAQEDGFSLNDEIELLRRFRFSKIDQLKLTLTHNKLSGKLANLIYSLDATNTDFYPHQYKPVLALIDTPSKGILIGDEVGLGKTIEAGLIWTELKTRYNSKRLIIVCKAFLKTKWINEFRNKFGIDLQSITPSDLLERLKSGSENESFAFIASYDSLRPPKAWMRDIESGEVLTATESSRRLLARYLDENQQRDLFDLVVFDECQYMRNERTMNYDLGQLFSKTSMQVVMLSATPINNSSDDLFNLFTILDESLFPYKSEFPRLIHQNKPIIKVRDALMSGHLSDREEILQFLLDAKSMYLYRDNEQLKHLLENLPTQENLSTAKGRVDLAGQLDKINIFGKIFTRTRKREIQLDRPQREATSFPIVMTDIERVVYEKITNSIQQYADINDLKSGFLINMPQQQMCSSFAAAVHWWRLRIDRYQAEALDELEEMSNDSDEPLHKSGIRPLFEYISSSAFSLGDLSDLETNDSKYNALITQLSYYWKLNPGKKVILFSFFKATLRYLRERLQKDGVPSELLYGGLDKDIAIRRFHESSDVNLLLASEVAAEGVDLQFSSLVINYDLPWNPMRVEQRIGRIDRIGQKEKKILIWNFFYEDSVDDRIYMRLYQKLGLFEEALGGMEEIIGNQIDEIAKGHLLHQLSQEQVDRLIAQSEHAIHNVRKLEEQLDEKSSQLVAHGDFIQQSINETRQFGRYIKPEDLEIYFDTFFKENYQQSRINCVNPDKHQFKLELDARAVVDLQDYWNKEQVSFSTALTDQQRSSKTEFIFSNRIFKNQGNVEYLNQFHPVMKFISGRIQQSRSSNPNKVLIAGLLENYRLNLPEDIYVFACHRFSFSSNSRVVERLQFRAKGLNTQNILTSDESELLVSSMISHGKDWVNYGDLNPDKLVSHYGDLLNQLEEDFDEKRGQLQRETNDRVTVQKNSLEGYLLTKKYEFNQRVQQAIFDNKESLVKSQQTRWKNIEANLLIKLQKLESQKNLLGTPSFVAAGVIAYRNL